MASRDNMFAQIIVFTAVFVTSVFASDQCQVNPAQRKECGWLTIDEKHCLNRTNCCWNTTKHESKPPWCFYNSIVHGSVKNFLMCEHHPATNISCPSGLYITVVNAFYGYYPNSPCHDNCDPKQHPRCDACFNTHSTQIASQLCSCNNSCMINPKGSHWLSGTACDNFNNLLSVDYICTKEKDKSCSTLPSPSSSVLPQSQGITLLSTLPSVTVHTAVKASENMSQAIRAVSSSVASNVTAEVRNSQLTNQTAYSTQSMLNFSEMTSSLPQAQQTGWMMSYTSSKGAEIMPSTKPQSSVEQSTAEITKTTNISTSFPLPGPSQRIPFFNSTRLLETTLSQQVTTKKSVLNNSVFTQTAVFKGSSYFEVEVTSTSQSLSPKGATWTSSIPMSTKEGLPLPSNQSVVAETSTSIQNFASKTHQRVITTLENSPTTVMSLHGGENISLSTMVSAPSNLPKLTTTPQIAPSRYSSSVTKSSESTSPTATSSSLSTERIQPSPVSTRLATSSSVTTPVKTSGGTGLSSGTKIAIGVSVAVILFLMFVVLILCYKRKSNRRQFKYLDDFSPSPGTYYSMDPSVVQMSELEQRDADGEQTEFEDRSAPAGYDNVGLVSDGN